MSSRTEAMKKAAAEATRIFGEYYPETLVCKLCICSAYQETSFVFDVACQVLREHPCFDVLGVLDLQDHYPS